MTFANGAVVQEPILSVDDARRRLAWGLRDARIEHYNDVMQVHAEPGGARVTLTSDMLPHSAADWISAMQDQGLAAMKRHFEQNGR